MILTLNLIPVNIVNTIPVKEIEAENNIQITDLSKNQKNNYNNYLLIPLYSVTMKIWIPMMKYKYMTLLKYKVSPKYKILILIRIKE
jgi:hypothetical protein